MIRKLALVIFVLAAYVWVNDPGHVFHAETTISSDGVDIEIQAPTDDTDGTFFNSTAPLDTTQIDDQRSTEKDYPVILPTGTNVVTPTVLQDGTYIPEESPDGGHFAKWLDNSPAYSDGWVLQVNDSTHTTQWVDG